MVSIAQLPNAAAEKGAPSSSAMSGAGQTSPAETSTFADIFARTRSLHSAAKVTLEKSGKATDDSKSAPANEVTQTASSGTQPNGDTQQTAQQIPSPAGNLFAGAPLTVQQNANPTEPLPEPSETAARGASPAAAQSLEEGIAIPSPATLPSALTDGSDLNGSIQSAADGSAPANAFPSGGSSTAISTSSPKQESESTAVSSRAEPEDAGERADGGVAKRDAEIALGNVTSAEGDNRPTDFAIPEVDSNPPQQSNREDDPDLAVSPAEPATKQSPPGQRNSAVEVVPTIPSSNPAGQLESTVSPSADGSGTFAPNFAVQTSGESPVQVTLATQKTQSNNRERVLQEITSGLQESLKDIQTVAPAGAAATASSGKLAVSSVTPASAQTAAQDSSKQPGNENSGSNSGHSDNSNANGQKTSILESATAVKAAGQAVVSVDQPLHVPADAPAQPAGASAGFASRSSSDANFSGDTKPLSSAFTPLPTSQADVVKASELYQRVGGAEMRISMDTELLGSIDLRTVVHQSTVTATIGVQRSDIQTLLANELPALQHALSERNLHVEQISVLDSTIGARAGLGGNSHQQQNAPASHAFVASTALDTIPNWTEESQFSGNDISDTRIGAGRLSIHV
jgi:hypothetical protein